MKRMRCIVCNEGDIYEKVETDFVVVVSVGANDKVGIESINLEANDPTGDGQYYCSDCGTTYHHDELVERAQAEFLESKKAYEKAMDTFYKDLEKEQSNEN
jgi:hypothetical protein